MTDWYVYMVRCRDGSLYTGITTDPQRRLHEHNHSTRAAKYVRSRRPAELVYAEPVAGRSSASTREHQLKCLSRREKEILVYQCKLYEILEEE